MQNHRDALAVLGTYYLFLVPEKIDLSRRQTAMLITVGLGGPNTVRGLAAHLKVSKPVITRAANTLTSYGLMRRVKDQSDLRNVFLRVTPDGEAFLTSMADKALLAGLIP